MLLFEINRSLLPLINEILKKWYGYGFGLLIHHGHDTVHMSCLYYDLT